MIIHVMREPFGHIIIENCFNDKDYKIVWDELLFLQPKMKNGHETAASHNHYGNANKNGVGIFLHDIYRIPLYSEIYRITREFLSVSVHNAASQVDPYFKLFGRIIRDAVLVQCYANGDYYLPHNDSSIFTIVTMIHNTPKQFTGGELNFPEYNYQISFKNNHSIIFPSVILHEVKEVKMESKDPKDFRYTISMFLEDREVLQHSQSQNKENS